MKNYLSNLLLVCITVLSIGINTIKAQVISIGPLTGSAGLLGSGSNWSNLSRVLDSDGSASIAAALALGGTSKYMMITDLDVSVPSDAIIEGIEFNVRVRAATAFIGTPVVTDKSVRLVVGGDVVGSDNNLGSNWPTSFGNRTYGGSPSSWGVTGLSPADVNASNFGVAIAVNFGGLVLPSAQIDYATVTVYYSTPLPVTISSFTATSNNDHNHLAWQTVNELNNDLFIIQKSTDGSYFYDLTTLPGNQTSNTINNYSYDDYARTGEKEYYRLIQKDVDGSVTISSVVSVTANSTATAHIIHSSGASHLVITNCEGKNVEVVFSDLSGRILYNQTLIPTCNIHSINLNEKIPEYEAVIIKASYDGQLFSEHFIITQ